MIDPENVPAITGEEKVARYVLFSNHFRPSDQTVKPDALMPHPRFELSVTRHLQASEQELWGEGRRVAKEREKRLYGRADFAVESVHRQALQVVPDPLDENPNHANITRWPQGKPEQKIRALEIAADAKFLLIPNSYNSQT